MRDCLPIVSIALACACGGSSRIPDGTVAGAIMTGQHDRAVIFIAQPANAAAPDRAIELARNIAGCAGGEGSGVTTISVDSAAEARDHAKRTADRTFLLDAGRTDLWTLTEESGRVRTIAELRNPSTAADTDLAALADAGCREIALASDIARFWLVLTCTDGECAQFGVGRVSVQGYQDQRTITEYPWKSYWPLARQKAKTGFVVRIRFESGQQMVGKVYEEDGGECRYSLPDDYERSRKDRGWATLRDCR